MDFGLMGLLVHAGNLLYLFSYMLRDILWLRIVAIVAGLCLIPFYMTREIVLWEPIAWNAVFVIINVVQTYFLLEERRPIELEENEIKVYNLAFRSLTTSEFKKLINYATWDFYKTGKVLTDEGKNLDRIMVIFSGDILVKKHDREIACLRPGQFVGEMSFLTGEKASAEVVAQTDTIVVTWQFDELKKLLVKHPEIGNSFQYILSEDLIKKLIEEQPS